MEQAPIWSRRPDANRENVTRASTGGRSIVPHLVIAILLVVIALVGWRFVSRPKGRFAATGSVLSANVSSGTFTVQTSLPAPPTGRGFPHLTSHGATHVKISKSTVFQICRNNPVRSGVTSRGCAPGSFQAVKVGERVNIVGALSNNTVSAALVQVQVL